MKDSKIAKKFLLMLMTILMIFPMNLVHATTTGLEDSSEDITIVEENKENDEIIEKETEDTSNEVKEEKETNESGSNEKVSDSTNEESEKNQNEKKDEATEKENTNANEEMKEHSIEEEKKTDTTEGLDTRLSTEEAEELERKFEELKNIPDITPAAINFPDRISDDIDVDDEQIIYNKTAKPNGDGSYEVRLETYAKGESITSTSEKVIPTDIVMVIDESGSMNTLKMPQPLSTTKPEKQKNMDNYNESEKIFYKKEVEGSLVGSYKKVFVERELGGVPAFGNWMSEKSYSNGRVSNNDLWNDYNSNNKILAFKNEEGRYGKIDISRSGRGSIFSPYTYTYSVGGQVILESSREGTTPSFDNEYAPLYLLRNDPQGNIQYYDDFQYSYYYLNVKDERVYIKETNNNPSMGSDQIFDTEFYRAANIRDVSNMTVLKDVLNPMVEQLASNARKNDVNHRVAMVGFSYVNQTRLFVGGSYVELGGGERSNPGNDIEPFHYRNAYEDMNTPSGLANVKWNIEQLNGRGGTFIDTGNMVGNKVFEYNPIPLPGEEERNRIYVVFTDGVPGPLAALSGYDYATEQGAIREANIAKMRHNAPVYTVGVFEDADQTVRGPDRFEKSYARANWFMQQMSSNNGEPQEPSYYLSARNGDRLLESFLEIVNVTNSNKTEITLNEDTTIRDRIPAYFDLDESSVTVQKKEFKGQSEEDEKDEANWEKTDTPPSINIQTEGDEIIVSGFDYSSNYVGPRTVDGNTVYEGSKLEITFNVTPNSKFLGGNNVPTNVDAGIYKEKETEKPLYVFDKPKVDVPIKDFDVQVEDKNIYLNSSLDGEQLKNDAKVTFNQGTNQEFTLDLSKAADETHPYGLDETWQNEFVNISHDLVELDENGEVKTDQDGNPIIIEETDFKNLKNDSKYTVSVTISPKEEAATDEPALAKEKNDSGDIHVFKPIITYTDGSVYYGENTIDNFDNYRLDEGQEKWMWVDEEENKIFSTDVTMNDPTIPNLVYEENYVKDSDNLDGKVNTKNDMYLKSTIKIEDMDISDDVYFEHECGVLDDCSFDPEKGQFMIHVKTVTLDIEKRGGKVKDPYVFSILRADLDAENYEDYTEAAIVRTRNLDGSDSISIKELPVGKYKVIENTDWSWRYNPTYQAERYTTADKKKEESALGDQKVELTPSYDLGKVSVENTKDPEKNNWLSGFSDLISNIFGEAQKIGNNEDRGGS